jgi:hypothetical protein
MSSANYNVWDGTTKGDSTVLRVISAADTEIDDAPALNIPAGQFTFEGILIQFCSSPSAGCLNGYQLQGTRKSDIIPQIAPLGAFNLLTPINNTRVVVKDGDNTPIQITWETSSNATSYRWLADNNTGNFNNPLLRINADNSGKDNKLTFTSGALSAALQGLGVAQGDSIVLKWTVRGYRELGDSIQATSNNLIKLVRFKESSGSVNSNIAKGFRLFPNPANDYLFIQTEATEAINYSICDAIGKVMSTGQISANEYINIESLNKGIYFFRTEKGRIRFIKN